MKLALLGYPIKHSLSPELYRELLGDQLDSYKLLEIENSDEIPSLEQLSQTLDGLNITAPYKKHFLSSVKITSPTVRNLGAINTISFSPNGAFATNTDFLGVESLLKEFVTQFGVSEILLLGSGAMANMTKVLASQQDIPLQSFSRKDGDALEKLDLRDMVTTASPLIINSCSRSFVFQGELPKQGIFWDYNYRFPSHQDHLPQKVRLYIDGTELLRRQAQSAIAFWFETNPKLKC